MSEVTDLIPRTAIDRRTTGLLPSTCLDGTMLAPPRGLRCKLGTPPQELRSVHWPALVDECVRRVISALVNPAVVEIDGRYRRVGLLGTTVFECLPDGQWRAYDWLPEKLKDDLGGPRSTGAPVLNRLADATVVAEGVPWQALWLQRYGFGLRHALVQQWGERYEINPYVDWMLQRIGQGLWIDAVQQRVRSHIARALNLDPVLLRRARRRFWRTDGTPLRLRDYNLVLWQRTQWPHLQAEVPQFLPLLAQVWRQLPTPGEPVANLRALQRDWGIGPAFWRLLHREGTAWMRPLLRYYTPEARRDGVAALDLLRVAQHLGTRRLPPLWLLVEVLNLGGNPNRPKPRYEPSLDTPERSGLLGKLGHWVEQAQLRADPQALQQLSERMYLMLQWAWVHPDYVASRAMRQVTPVGLWRRALAWDNAQRVQAEDEARWPKAFDPRSIRSQDFRCVPLNSALAIWEESRHMRHCADAFTDRRRRGEYYLVSVRSKESGERVATIGIHWDADKLAVHQVAGFANARVAPQIHDLASLVASSMDLQRLRAGWGRSPKSEPVRPQELT